LLLRTVSILTLVFAVFVGVLLYNASNNVIKQIEVSPFTENPDKSISELAERLAGAIRFKTISHQDPSLTDFHQFELLHEYIQQLFPLVHKHLQLQKLGSPELSLLYTWKGTRYGTSEDKPFAMSSHLDVVPVPEDTLSFWSVDPFAGVVDEEFIWGRGSIDDKQGVMGILEAVEWLLKDGFQPKNTIYLAFGHDEEISGYKGALYMSSWFKKNNIKLDFLFDEGMTLLRDGPFPIDKPGCGIIGISEKGYATVKLTVNDAGGHSSLSVKETAINILARAITSVYDNPMPNQFNPNNPFYSAVEYVSAFSNNKFFSVFGSNMWLFKSLIAKALSMDALASVNLRTTSSATIIHGGTKENVLPTQAYAAINHRLVPGDTVQSVLDHLKTVINNPRVEIELQESLEASPISSTNNVGYKSIEKSVLETFGDVLVLPSLFTANTDTRHYWDVTDNIYRFCPTDLTPADLSRFHGIDERISRDNYMKMIRFFYQFIRNAN